MAELTPISQADLARFLPEKEDKERLAELLAIVESSTTENEKVAQLGSRIQELGPVVLRVLKLLVLR